VVSKTRPSEKFAGVTNSDLSFSGPYVIQGNYNGYQVWDIANRRSAAEDRVSLPGLAERRLRLQKPALRIGRGHVRPPRLRYGGGARLGERGPVTGHSHLRHHDIANPKYIGNVQTCRGSHTHTVVDDPTDQDNVYIYVSGRPACGRRTSSGMLEAGPGRGPELGAVPYRSHQGAARASGAGEHRELAADLQRSHGSRHARRGARGYRGRGAGRREARAHGGYTVLVHGTEYVLPPGFIQPRLDSIVQAGRGPARRRARTAPRCEGRSRASWTRSWAARRPV